MRKDNMKQDLEHHTECTNEKLGWIGLVTLVIIFAMTVVGLFIR